jgi:hypothetical protein
VGEVLINSGYGNLVLSGQSSEVGAITSIPAQVGSLSIQGLNSTILPGEVIIQAIIAQMIMAGQSAFVYNLVGTIIQATIGSMQLSPQNALILLEAIIQKIWATASTSRATVASITTESLGIDVENAPTGKAQVTHE